MLRIPLPLQVRTFACLPPVDLRMSIDRPEGDRRVQFEVVVRHRLVRPPVSSFNDLEFASDEDPCAKRGSRLQRAATNTINQRGAFNELLRDGPFTILGQRHGTSTLAHWSIQNARDARARAPSPRDA